MADTANYGSLPFDEAVNFFRRKLSLPTAGWTDLWEDAHDHAFVVAGAMRDDLLADLREAVDKAISQGTTLAQFRKDFDKIVQRHGWAYKGGRNWRTRVIYSTNMRTAYQAGRYRQLKRSTRLRPYWRYKHSDAVEHPRPEHQAWDGLVLRHDDPFWDTHYPPNGWGCQCRVFGISERELRKMGKTEPDQAPPIEQEEHLVGQRSPFPRVVEVPKGIDPGWGYAPGQRRAINDAISARMAKGLVLPPEIASLGIAGMLGRESSLTALIENYRSWVADIVAGKLANAGGRKEIGVIAPKVLEGLERQGITPATAMISIEHREVTHLLADARKGHKALTEAMVQELPRYLARPDAVIWDSTGKRPALLYVFSPADDTRKGRIAIRVNYQQRKELVNAVRSGSLVPEANLKQPGMILLEGEL